MRLALVLGALVFAAGCGRSELDFDIPDGSPPDAVSSTDGPQADDASVQDSAESADAPSFGDAPAFGDAYVPDGSVHPDSGPGTCSPANCGGCCQGETCVDVPKQSPAACGIGGVSCFTCPVPGASCWKGVCEYPQPNCGPSNCPGCCLDANTCSNGTIWDACGFGGQLCQGCGPYGTHLDCVPQPGGGGKCQPGCDSSNCEGCCNGSICEVGQYTSQCGTGGQACMVCAPSEICASLWAGGQCQPPCSPATCAGCCAGDVCAVGTQDIACGSGGGACADCNANHYRCVNETCHP